jgi:dsDNA-specific endonuclease/ATPase MutS2
MHRLWRWWRHGRHQLTTESPAAEPFAVAETDWQDPFPAPVEWEITDTLDLHSIPPRQVKAVVEEYLFQAHERGFAVVRLIHGKGIGVQRATVREILSRTPFVREYHDAPDASGWGATIAHLQTGPQISETVSGQLE